jgi:hypothetical protein
MGYHGLTSWIVQCNEVFHWRQYNYVWVTVFGWLIEVMLLPSILGSIWSVSWDSSLFVEDDLLVVNFFKARIGICSVSYFLLSKVNIGFVRVLLHGKMSKSSPSSLFVRVDRDHVLHQPCNLKKSNLNVPEYIWIVIEVDLYFCCAYNFIEQSDTVVVIGEPSSSIKTLSQLLI